MNSVQTVTLRLSDLQDRAAERATNVLIAEQDLLAAEPDLKAQRARRRPRLELTANLPNYFRTSTEVTQDDGTVAFREIELNNSFVGLSLSQPITATGGTVSVESQLQRTDNLVLDGKRYNGSPVRLFVRQPLWAYNPWKWERELLPLAETARRRELDAARADAVLQVTDAFFELVIADQERRLADTNLAANRRLFAVAEERFELGKINRGDLVQLRLEMTTAEQNSLRAERLVSNASRNIQTILGLPYQGEQFVPELPEEGARRAGATLDVIPRRERGAMVDGATGLPDLETARAQMLRNRPEPLVARERVLLAERELERTRRELGPQIDIQAGFGLIRNAPELAPIYQDPQDERLLSVNLALPILDWGERKALTRRAAGERDLAEQLADRAELDLDAELRLLYEQWELVGEELALAAEMKALAEERFLINSRSYTLGAIPLPQLTLAQQFRDAQTRGRQPARTVPGPLTGSGRYRRGDFRLRRERQAYQCLDEPVTREGGFSAKGIRPRP